MATFKKIGFVLAVAVFLSGCQAACSVLGGGTMGSCDHVIVNG